MYGGLLVIILFIMGNFFSNEFEKYNTTSINMCMGFLLVRYDIFEYEKTKIKKPISIELYKYLENKMEKFLQWYKNNKNDNYLPSCGIQPMYSYDIINTVFLMNKQNKKLKKIMKIWNSRDINFSKLKNTLSIRCDIDELPSIPNDPMINMF